MKSAVSSKSEDCEKEANIPRLMENKPTQSTGITKMGRGSKRSNGKEKKNKNKKNTSEGAVYYLNAPKEVIQEILNAAENEKASIIFSGEDGKGRILLPDAESFQFTMSAAGEEDSENLCSPRLDALRRNGVIVGDVNISGKSSEQSRDVQEDAPSESTDERDQ